MTYKHRIETNFKEVIDLEQKKIDRINELTAKSRTPEGLTEEEKAEREVLRNEFRAAIKGNLTAQLENIEFVDAPTNK